MSERETTCIACGGRGYFNCDCWPGDCICGFGDETCDECMGEGVIYDDGYEDDHWGDLPPAPEPHAEKEH